MNINNTVIVLDWDDTLFPTSWVINNKIDLTDPNNRIIYYKFFNKLDNILYDLLSNMLTCGKVIIITNAMIKWIELSSSVLSKTQDLLKKIKVVSARENYNKITSIKNWKKNTFSDEIDDHFTNIISMGDAYYEYHAIINLYKKQEFHDTKYFKTVQFIRNPQSNILIEELELINNNLNEICNIVNHLDLDFSHIKS